MRSPEGADTARGVYREVVPPERIVFTDTFADEEGNLVEPARYGMARTGRRDAGDGDLRGGQGKTKLTLHQSVSVSVAESTGAMQGWIELLDRLAAELAQA